MDTYSRSFNGNSPTMTDNQVSSVNNQQSKVLEADIGYNVIYEGYLCLFKSYFHSIIAPS